MPRLVKGDMALVVTGNDAGKTGKVLKVFPGKDRVVIEGVNFIKRHTKPSQKNPQGGIQEREAAIHASNAMLYCTKCGRGTRIRHTELGDGTKVRACGHCGEVIEKPRV
ncbi:MAG TPA: 50S ribosomal protein L24 [Gemmatimonadota bacterium]|nr:50S ribosomal protein L24 [Gemmatimonadota bacterium]